MTARPSQSGFTLIELLLAMTLMAVIFGLAYGGFRAVTRASISGEAMVERTNSLRVAHQFLRRQLSRTLPLVIEEIEGFEDERIMFLGESDWMRFVAPMPGYLSYGGPYVQELRLERGRNGYDLVFTYAILNGYEPGDLDEIDPILLMEDIRSGTFGYIGFDEEGEPGSWDTLWEFPDMMPLAVTVELDMDEEQLLHWPALVVPLMIDGGGRGQARGMSASDRIDPAVRRRMERERGQRR